MTENNGGRVGYLTLKEKNITEVVRNHGYNKVGVFYQNILMRQKDKRPYQNTS